MCPAVEAHCPGLNITGHTCFSEEKLQVRERGSHQQSGGPLPQVVDLEVGALGPLHSSVMYPWTDPSSFRAEQAVGISKWCPFA